MPAYALLNGKTVVFPDVTKAEVVPGGLVTLRRQNDDNVGTLKLGEGDFVTTGDEPQVK